MTTQTTSTLASRSTSGSSNKSRDLISGNLPQAMIPAGAIGQNADGSYIFQSPAPAPNYSSTNSVGIYVPPPTNQSVSGLPTPSIGGLISMVGNIIGGAENQVGASVVTGVSEAYDAITTPFYAFTSITDGNTGIPNSGKNLISGLTQGAGNAVNDILSPTIKSLSPLLLGAVAVYAVVSR